MAVWRRNTREYESTLSEARIQKGLTVNELCAYANISPTLYAHLNDGKVSPIKSDGSIKPSVQRLAEILDMDLSDLFPRYFCPIHQYHISKDEIVDTFHRGNLSPDFNDPEEKYLHRERLEMLDKLLDKLSNKQRQVMEMYYVGDMTYTDIGKVFDLSKERIRQLEKESIRRIRYHYHRMKDCRYLLEDLLYS